MWLHTRLSKESIIDKQKFAATHDSGVRDRCTDKCSVNGLTQERLIAAQVEWYIQSLCYMQYPCHIPHHLRNALGQQCTLV